MIIGKKHTLKYGIWALALQQETVSGVCVSCHKGNHNHTLIQEHVHEVYAVILGLQFIYKSMYMQTRKPELACM